MFIPAETIDDPTAAKPQPKKEFPLFGRYVSMQGKAETVKISVNASAGIHLKQWHPDQKTIRRRDGRIEISFPVNSGGSKMPYANVISWVLSMGRHATVLSPKRLRELVRAEIQTMAGQ